MIASELFPARLPVAHAVRRQPGGRDWWARLPALVAELAARWELRLAPPYHGGSTSWAAPVLRAGGGRAVLKVTWPHREARAEGAALRLWDGRGAVRLLAHDPERWALLLERCEPGTELGRAARVPAHARLLAGARVLRGVWTAGEKVAGALPGRGGSVGAGGGSVWPGGGEAGGGGFERLADVAREWADLVEARAARHAWPPGAAGLPALGAALLRELPHTARRNVVLHGDLNPGNVLAAGRAPWLAIDAKPLVGDPAYDPWPLIEQVGRPFAHAQPGRELARRIALVADAAGTDAERVGAWAVARRVEYALWTVRDEDGGDAAPARAARLLAEAGTLARAAGL